MKLKQNPMLKITIIVAMSLIGVFSSKTIFADQIDIHNIVTNKTNEVNELIEEAKEIHLQKGESKCLSLKKNIPSNDWTIAEATIYGEISRTKNCFYCEYNKAPENICHICLDESGKKLILDSGEILGVIKCTINLEIKNDKSDDTVEELYELLIYNEIPLSISRPVLSSSNSEQEIVIRTVSKDYALQIDSFHPRSKNEISSRIEGGRCYLKSLYKSEDKHRVSENMLELLVTDKKLNIPYKYNAYISLIELSQGANLITVRDTQNNIKLESKENYTNLSTVKEASKYRESFNPNSTGSYLKPAPIEKNYKFTPTHDLFIEYRTEEGTIYNFSKLGSDISINAPEHIAKIYFIIQPGTKINSLDILDKENRKNIIVMYIDDAYKNTLNKKINHLESKELTTDSRSNLVVDLSEVTNAVVESRTFWQVLGDSIFGTLGYATKPFWDGVSTFYCWSWVGLPDGIYREEVKNEINQKIGTFANEQTLLCLIFKGAGLTFNFAKPYLSKSGNVILKIANKYVIKPIMLPFNKAGNMIFKVAGKYIIRPIILPAGKTMYTIINPVLNPILNSKLFHTMVNTAGAIAKITINGSKKFINFARYAPLEKVIPQACKRIKSSLINLGKNALAKSKNIFAYIPKMYKNSKAVFLKLGKNTLKKSKTLYDKSLLHIRKNLYKLGQFLDNSYDKLLLEKYDISLEKHKNLLWPLRKLLPNSLVPKPLRIFPYTSLNRTPPGITRKFRTAMLKLAKLNGYTKEELECMEFWIESGIHIIDENLRLTIIHFNKGNFRTIGMEIRTKENIKVLSFLFQNKESILADIIKNSAPRKKAVTLSTKNYNAEYFYNLAKTIGYDKKFQDKLGKVLQEVPSGSLDLSQIKKLIKNIDPEIKNFIISKLQNPKWSKEMLEEAQKMLSQNKGIPEIAKALSRGEQVIYHAIYDGLLELPRSWIEGDLLQLAKECGHSGEFINCVKELCEGGAKTWAKALVNSERGSLTYNAARFIERKLPHGPFTTENLLEIQKLILDGHSPNFVRKKFGLSISAISRAFQQGRLEYKPWKTEELVALAKMCNCSGDVLEKIRLWSKISPDECFNLIINNPNLPKDDIIALNFISAKKLFGLWDQDMVMKVQKYLQQGIPKSEIAHLTHMNESLISDALNAGLLEECPKVNVYSFSLNPNLIKETNVVKIPKDKVKPRITETDKGTYSLLESDAKHDKEFLECVKYWKSREYSEVLESYEHFKKILEHLPGSAGPEYKKIATQQYEALKFIVENPDFKTRLSRNLQKKISTIYMTSEPSSNIPNVILQSDNGTTTQLSRICQKIIAKYERRIDNLENMLKNSKYKDASIASKILLNKIFISEKNVEKCLDIIFKSKGHGNYSDILGSLLDTFQSLKKYELKVQDIIQQSTRYIQHK